MQPLDDAPQFSSPYNSFNQDPRQRKLPLLPLPSLPPLPPLQPALHIQAQQGSSSRLDDGQLRAMAGGSDDVDASGSNDDDLEESDYEAHRDDVVSSPVRTNKRKSKGGQATNRKKAKVPEQRDGSADWSDEQKEADLVEAVDKLGSLVGDTVSVYGSCLVDGKEQKYPLGLCQITSLVVPEDDITKERGSVVLPGYANVTDLRGKRRSRQGMKEKAVSKRNLSWDFTVGNNYIVDHNGMTVYHTIQQALDSKQDGFYMHHSVLEAV